MRKHLNVHALWEREISNLHLSIFTATLIVDCVWLIPWAIASTTRPKAPEPNVRPVSERERKRETHFFQSKPAK